MNQKAQVSIEFLLVFVALLGFVSVFSHFFSELQEAAKFGLDLKNAQRFVSDVKSFSETLEFLGEGSGKSFSYKVMNSWSFSGGPGNCILVVSTERGNSSELRLPESVSCEPRGPFTEELSLSLKKTGSGLVLSD